VEMKRIKSDCRWAESCDCSDIKITYCSKCIWYWAIDSGYGYCKALPQHTIVAWCRDCCRLFEPIKGVSDEARIERATIVEW